MFTKLENGIIYKITYNRNMQHSIEFYYNGFSTEY